MPRWLAANCAVLGKGPGKNGPLLDSQILINRWKTVGKSNKTVMLFFGPHGSPRFLSMPSWWMPLSCAKALAPTIACGGAARGGELRISIRIWIWTGIAWPAIYLTVLQEAAEHGEPTTAKRGASCGCTAQPEELPALF